MEASTTKERAKETESSPTAKDTTEKDISKKRLRHIQHIQQRKRERKQHWQTSAKGADKGSKGKGKGAMKVKAEHPTTVAGVANRVT